LKSQQRISTNRGGRTADQGEGSIVHVADCRSKCYIRSMKLSALTPDQIRELAPLVPTSVSALRQNASLHRGVSAQRAIAIERAASKIGLSVPRESMSPGCAQCEFAKACRQVQRGMK
jgi:DNA-binding transcriptional regulator YdaS (Cro superfamily)